MIRNKIYTKKNRVSTYIKNWLLNFKSSLEYCELRFYVKAASVYICIHV